MDKAYSSLHVKSIAEQDDFLTVRGIASTPSIDRQNDAVMPMGARFSLPIPLLLHHKHDMPIGHVTRAVPTAKGIEFEAKIPRIKQPGVLKDRVDEAIHSLQHRLLACVSVGFSAVAGKVKQLANGGMQFDEWDWHELSLCVIPAQREAVITSVKSLSTADEPAPLTQDLIQQIKAADGAATAGLCPACAGPLQAIKSIDQQHLTPASGPAADPAPPGVTGTPLAAPRGPVKLIPRGHSK